MSLSTGRFISVKPKHCQELGSNPIPPSNNYLYVKPLISHSHCRWYVPWLSVFFKMPLSLNYCMRFYVTLLHNGEKVHYLARSMEVLICLKFLPLKFVPWPCVYRVVTRSSFGVTQQHNVSGRKLMFHQYVPRSHTKPRKVVKGEGHFTQCL